MKNNRIKHHTRFISVFIAAVIMFQALNGCVKTSDTINVLTFAKDALREVYPDNVEKRLHITQPDSAQLKFIARSGLIELYLDESTYSVAVCETLKKQYWYTLPIIPAEGVAAYDYSASPVCVTVVNGSDTLYLNAQDNSVAYGNVTYESIATQVKSADGATDTDIPAVTQTTGIQVNYIITPDKETADKKQFDTTDIAFLVSLKYYLKDGSLYVSSQNTNLSGNTNAVIKDLKLLEFFGATSTAQAGDFLLVPDGSGALIFTAAEDPAFQEMTFHTYAGNRQPESADGGKASVIAAYGIKKGDGAFAALIEKGDAIAHVSADRSAGKSGFNKIGVTFNVTEVKDVEKGNKIKRYIGYTAYSGETELCFRFLSGGYANYSGMAAVCREQLIRDGMLSAKTLEEEEYLPFNLTVAGTVKKDIIRNIPIQLTTKLTTFDQAQDMLARMKSKGVNSICLRYSGALSGGLNQKDITASNISRLLGGEKDFAQLNSYMITQKMQLFIDIGLITSGKTYLTGRTKAATAINQEKSYTQTKNDFYEYVGDEYFTQNLRPVAGIDKAVLKTLTRFKNTDLGGFCLNDAGKLLYSDYSGTGSDLQKTADTIAEKITALSTGRKIMVDTGNFFSVKNADVIMNIPMSLESGEQENAPYRYVPFIQLILHGIVDYSGTPVNRYFAGDDAGVQAKELEFGVLTGQEQKSIKDSMLKCIEYGACPGYEWTYRELDKESAGVETFYYDDWINQAVDFYLKANTALADIRTSRMVKHTMIQPGVFCTEYEASKIVYVNYTYADVDIGGVTVKARDFIRL